MENWPILGRLKKAVNKVRFMLKFRLHRWFLINHRHLSFGDRPGLWVCMDEAHESSNNNNLKSRDNAALSRRMSLQRTISISRPAYSDIEGDDINEKADIFIANFHRQLQLERQISLELQYCRGNSFDYAKSA